MTRPADRIHLAEHLVEGEWPGKARAVSHIGRAFVVEGDTDFDLDDLNLVRRQFSGRRVTLDGDVITVWPAPSAGPHEHSFAGEAADAGIPSAREKAGAPVPHRHARPHADRTGEYPQLCVYIRLRK